MYDGTGQKIVHNLLTQVLLFFSLPTDNVRTRSITNCYKNTREKITQNRNQNVRQMNDKISKIIKYFFLLSLKITNVISYRHTNVTHSCVFLLLNKSMTASLSIQIVLKLSVILLALQIPSRVTRSDLIRFDLNRD